MLVAIPTLFIKPYYFFQVCTTRWRKRKLFQKLFQHRLKILINRNCNTSATLFRTCQKYISRILQKHTSDLKSLNAWNILQLISVSEKSLLSCYHVVLYYLQKLWMMVYRIQFKYTIDIFQAIAKFTVGKYKPVSNFINNTVVTYSLWDKELQIIQILLYVAFSIF